MANPIGKNGFQITPNSPAGKALASASKKSTSSRPVGPNGFQITPNSPKGQSMIAAGTYYNNAPVEEARTPAWNLSKWTTTPDGNWGEAPTLTVDGQVQKFNTPDEYINALSGLQSQGSDGPLDQFINEFRAVAPAFKVPKTIDSSLMGNTTPVGNINTSSYNPAKTTLQANLGIDTSYPAGSTQIGNNMYGPGGALLGPAGQQGMQTTKGTQGTTTPPTQKGGTNYGPVVTQSPYANSKIEEFQGALNPIISEYQRQAKLLAQQGTDETDMKIQQGVNEKTKLVNDLAIEELQAKQAYQKQVEEIRKNSQGKFGGGVQRDLEQAERDYTDKSIATGIKKALANNDLESANATVKLALQAIYEPIKAEMAANKTIFDMVKDSMTEKETLAYQAYLRQQENLSKPDSKPASVQEYEYAKKYDGYKGSYTQYQNDDANRKARVASAGNGMNGFTMAQINSSLNANTGNFDGEPIVKNFNVVKSGNDFAKSISSTSKNPSDHQALIYAFAKAMDPDSVVREGEYATVEKYSQSWVNKFGKSFTQALEGTGFLSQTAMDNMKKTIASKYAVSESQYKNLKKEYDMKETNIRSGKGNTIQDYLGTASNPIDTTGKVRIQKPDGSTGYIPKANLSKAIKAGAKQIK